AVVLLAVDRHLDGCNGHALGLTFAALLLRPEAGPFFLAYSAYLWTRRPQYRPWIVAMIVAVPALWLLPDRVGSGDWLRSLRRAQFVSPRDRRHPGVSVLNSALGAVLVPIVAGAGVAAVMGVRRYVKRRQ